MQCDFLLLFALTDEKNYRLLLLKITCFLTYQTHALIT